DPPTISPIGNQSVNEDTPLMVAFTIGDAETPAANLTLTGTSTNTALVANTNIFFDGSGSSRSVKICPTTNQVGTTLISLMVNDGTASATSSFLLTVNLINDPPT